MSIGTTIKKLRRDREMTQEVLAEYLGVSVSAVSQWEADKTSPDLSLIAPLCHLFSVSADILLEIDLAEKKEQIAAIIAEANALGDRGYNCEAYNLLSDGHKRFPDDFDIMYYLMYNAFWLTDSDCTDEERTQYQNTAIQIAERTLESCTIDFNRHGAIQILCCLYPRIGKTDRAIELANSMPPISISQEVLLSFIGTGETKYRAKKAEIDTYIQFLSVSMADYYLADDNGTPYYSEDDNAVLRDKQIAFLTLMFEDGDFGFYHTHLARSHEHQARYYAERGDSELALQHLSKATDHAIAFVDWAACEKHECTSLLFRHYTVSPCFSTGIDNNDAMEILEKTKNPVYDSIRETSAFSDLTQKLQARAAKWDPAATQ